MSEHERHSRPPRFVPTLTEVVDGQPAPLPGDGAVASHANERVATGLPEREAFTVAPLLKSRDGVDGPGTAAGASGHEREWWHPQSGEAIPAGADFAASGGPSAAFQPSPAVAQEWMPQPWAPGDGFFSPPVAGGQALPAQPPSGLGFDAGDAARVSVPAGPPEASWPAETIERDQAHEHGTERDGVLDDLERLSAMQSEPAAAPLDWSTPVAPAALDAGASERGNAQLVGSAFNAEVSNWPAPQPEPFSEPTWQPDAGQARAASSDGAASPPWADADTVEALPMAAPQPGVAEGVAWVAPPSQDLPAMAEPLADSGTEGPLAHALGPLPEEMAVSQPTTMAFGRPAQQADPAVWRALLPDDFQEQLLHRVMQRVDAVLTDRVGEVIAAVIERQTRSLLPSLREELAEVIRKSVDEAMAEELAAAPLSKVQSPTPPGNA